MTASILGLDVGGANLKGAHVGPAGATARSVPFALWRRPADLPNALRDLAASLPQADVVAVTMTGELCDCFADKREGVHAILNAVEQAAAGIPVRVWLNSGRFTDLGGAWRDYLRAASANWLALATFAGRLVPSGPVLLLDVGSTTADVVPLLDGRPVPHGRTDPERLRSGELVYRGARRTPVCALTAGGAAELFATTLDVCLVLGLVPEDPADTDTADGRPATRAAAHARLARMLCADLATCTEGQRLDLAREVHSRLVAVLAGAVGRVATRLPRTTAAAVVAGSGEFLAREALARQRAFAPCPVVSLAEQLGPAASAAACAHAVAVLCAEGGR